MTPIQQAIEQVKKQSQENSDDYSDYSSAMEDTLSILQSLLPVEKEWAQDVFDAGWDYREYETKDVDFEQYYSQFNEVK